MVQQQSFEDQMRSAKKGALLVAGLLLLSRFLGFCALTWATVVLLGGFASDLRLLDFYLISILLLLEAARLFIVHIFSKLLSRALFRERPHPEHFQFTDRQPFWTLCLDLVAQGLSSSLAFCSLAFAIARLVLSHLGHALAEKDPPASGHSNLPTSLRIFYILVILNSSSAIASSLLRLLLRQCCRGNFTSCFFFKSSCCFFSNKSSTQSHSRIKQNSVISFHDEVYKTALEAGLPEADQLDILDYAFTKLTNDYKRNIRPPLMKQINKEMIHHLYKSQHGIAMACEYLKGGGDVWKQLVAANLPGFWVEEERVEGQVALFWALRGRIYGAGKDAESALNSIECLGQAWEGQTSRAPAQPYVYPFLVNDPMAGTNVVDTLVDVLLEPIRPTLLFQVRAFEACCRHSEVLRHLYKEDMGALQGGATPERRISSQLQAVIGGGGEGGSRLQRLCCKLDSIVSEEAAGAHFWTTTKMYAGNALVNLLCYGRPEWLEQNTKDRFADAVAKSIDPAAAQRNNYYFWVNDLIVVEQLRSRLALPCYARWNDVRLRQPDGTELSDRAAIDRLVREARGN